MSIRELDQVSRRFKKSSDASVLQTEINLYTDDPKRDAAKLMIELEKNAKRQKRSKAILITILYD